MGFESTQFSALILTVLSILLIVPSLRKQPGIGVIPSLLIIGLILWQRREGWQALGLTAPGSWLATIGSSLIFGILIALLSVMVVEPLSERLTGAEHDLSALGTIRGNLRATLTWVAAAWLMAATLEEIVFRGFMMREFARLLGTGAAANLLNILITSMVFGLAHWYQSRAGALSTGMVSLALGALFIWNEFQLWLLILTHGVIDTVGLLLIYSGGDERLKNIFFRPHGSGVDAGARSE